MNRPRLTETLAIDGYVWLPGVLGESAILAARSGCEQALAAPAAITSLIGEPGSRPHGARNLLRLWPAVMELALLPQLASVIRELLGPNAGVVRGLYFDKPPGDGWALPWHRDTTVAVRKHHPSSFFGKPTTKASVPHVEAPDELLETMLTARIHLDDMTDDNGPLRVTPGSHQRDTANREPVTLHCHAGDVLLMRPLLLHASAGCSLAHTGHRRIIHLEFATSATLPDGYEWDTFIMVTDSRRSR